MNTSVTPEQTAHYQRDGYVVVEDFLSPGELTDLVAAVTDAVVEQQHQVLDRRQRRPVQLRPGQRVKQYRVPRTPPCGVTGECHSSMPFEPGCPVHGRVPVCPNTRGLRRCARDQLRWLR